MADPVFSRIYAIFIMYLFIFIIDCSDRFLYRKITVLQTMLNATANQLIQIKNIDKLQIKLKLLNFDYVTCV